MNHRFKSIFISLFVILLVSILLYRLVTVLLFPGSSLTELVFTKPYTQEGLVPHENGLQFKSSQSNTTLVIPLNWGYKQGKNLQEMTELGEVLENIEFGNMIENTSLFQYLSVSPHNKEAFNYLSICLLLSGECSSENHSGIEYIKLTKTSESGAYMTQSSDQSHIKLFIYSNLEEENLIKIMESIQI